MDQQSFDAIIIGAGLGGLLSAAQLLQRGKRVVVLERLPHCGGRFTAKTFQGTQVSTGAVHMIPFGSSGVLARMLRRLKVPHRFFDADVFGSFHVHGRQIRSRGLLGLFKVFGPRQFFWFTRVGYLMFFRHLPTEEQDLPFDLWLERHINTRRNPELTAFFERISRFALSLELRQVSTAEVIKMTKNMFRYGPPGIVEGGCGALTGELEHHILDRGADIRLRHDVLQIQHDGDRATGVRVRNKANGEESLLFAPLVISDVGPRATDALLHNQQITQAEVLKKQMVAAGQTRQNIEAQWSQAGGEHLNASSRDDDIRIEHFVTGAYSQEAVGLKIHLLSDVSLIPHKGIMYCLDTRRIAGMVQPTNSDPRLAPPGKHLLISHQVIQSNHLETTANNATTSTLRDMQWNKYIEEEKELALADLRMMFGEAFEKHCRVLTMSMYRGEWPVNRIAQGADVTPETSVQGLYLVGDAVKPSGYLMVEGVAQGVNSFLDLLDTRDGEEAARQDDPAARRPPNVTLPPSRFNAIRWLWEAPGNS